MTVAPDTTPDTAPRRGDWIATSTGRRLWPLDPRPGDFDIRDIARGLSQEPRFGGQARWHYSVAQHSFLAAWMATRVRADDTWRDFAREALMHDAAEGVGFKDFPRPFKRQMPEYQAVLRRAEVAIAQQFGMPIDMTPEMHELDNRMLVTEAAALMTEVEGLAWWREPHWPSPFKGPFWPQPLGAVDLIERWTPEEAEASFLAMFALLFPEFPL